MVKIKRTVIIAVLILTILLPGLGLWSCSSGGYSGKLETITLAIPPLEQNALIYVAESQKLFFHNGLNIVIKDFDSGATSLDALLNGAVDMAEAVEFPFIRMAYAKAPLQIITCNDKFENDYILGRKDRGIETISDLKGKRIGVTLKTINEFYLGRFLSLHGLTLQDSTLVDLSPAQFLSATMNGDVDAIIAWQPYVNRIQRELSQVVVWPAQSSQAAYGILVANTEWITGHTNTVERFLKALKESEDFVVRHPDEVKAIIQKRLNYDPGYMSSIWSLHQFSLSLNQTLVVAMKDEAQWLINQNLTAEKVIPEFTNYIYFDGLKAVKPEAVNIIR